MIRSLLLTTARLLVPAALLPAGIALAATEMARCDAIARQCRDGAAKSLECQRKVDMCMSEAACEEVYYSCLELMEIEEGLSEEACRRKQAECVKKRLR